MRRFACSLALGALLVMGYATAWAQGDVDADGDGLTADEEALLGTRDDAADTDGDGLDDGLEVGRRADADPASRTDPTRADTDNDGLDDGEEDADGNGRVDGDETDPTRADTDGGGASDGVEVDTGTNPLDPTDDPEDDADRDGLSAAEEAELGTNPLDPDTDRDGLEDGVEAAGPTDPLDDDSDDDGLEDGDEVELGTDPNRADSDGGGTPDGREVGEQTDPNNPEDDLGRDPDGDGLSIREEQRNGLDPLDADTDDDGVADGDERNPLIDTDNDGLINALDHDSDNDGLPDGLELGRERPTPDTAVPRGRFVPDADPRTTTDPLRADTDNGGVSDGEEDLNRNGRIDAGETDPNDAEDDGSPPVDTDMDGLTDAYEVELGLDPTDTDSDDDGWLDGEEQRPDEDTDMDGLINALDPDSDDDGLTDGLEVGVSERPADSDPAVFVADSDPSTTTDPLRADSDGGGALDAQEDVDRDGAQDPGETNPRDANDDRQVMMPDAGVDADMMVAPEPEPEPMDMGMTAEPEPEPDGGLGTQRQALEADEIFGGCAVSPAPSGLSGLALLALLALGLRRREHAVAGLALLGLALWSGPAQAVEADRFSPAIGGGGVLELESAASRGDVDLRTGLWLRVAGRTLAADLADGRTDYALSGPSLRADATLAVDLIDRLTLGVAVPTVLAREARDGFGDAIDGSGAGDLRLLIKALVWATPDDRFSVGLAAPMRLGTGDPERWLGAGGFVVTPTLLFDANLAPVDVRVNLGYRVAPDDSVLGQELGSALRFGAGARYAIDGTAAAVELALAGESYTSALFDGPSTPVEAHVGGHLRVTRCLAVKLGVGLPISSGVGAAQYRVVTGLVHHCLPIVAPDPVGPTGPTGPASDPKEPPPPPAPSDRDGDGITDDQDACPDEAEDKDGFEDADGCPDPDNDKDGIGDFEDRCADEPEDKDGFDDLDGCPDPDNDQDGLGDNIDQCPNQPETRNGVRDDDGCPEQTVTRNGRAELSSGFIFVDERISFMPGTAELDGASLKLIADVAGLLQLRPDLKIIEVSGHTSSEGEEDANQRLSAARAAAVVQALQSNGVPGNRLKAAGYGETMPIESNRTASGRQANERVEFKVVEPAQ